MVKIKKHLVKDFSFAKGVICAYTIEKIVDLILALILKRKKSLLSKKC